MNVYSVSQAPGLQHEVNQREIKKAEPSKETAGRPSAGVRQPTTVSSPLVNGYGLGLSFSRDEVTGEQIITVYDLESGEIVRQIPPKEVLAFLRQFQQSKGLFISGRF